MHGRDAILRGAPAVLAAVALTFAGCGGGERQDHGDTAGTYSVELVRDSFPRVQHLADQTEMLISIKNTSGRRIPNVAATIEAAGEGTQAAAFGTLDQQVGLSSRSRPIWIVDDGPYSGDTAYANTWALGPMPAGAERDFVWRVTAIRSGRFRLTYRLAGSLPGAARLEQPGGRPVAGSFDVEISRAPAQARVTASGAVERVPAR
ncbi:hypothetical protein [Conexibacter sp. CPCC 206217]|uniref:hypothetical protein n=1 Tax=Conexibacter sp. CPCC 206217 TaxID=3064574 RepID=UPI00271CEFB9|nr:hypothetical protein [Conexibacter sp. CPCC 206217]MDO8209414.1 hypothetical protein [Conexibacter sp. CPCC 206217]